MSLNDLEEKTEVIDGKEVDTETGEIKDDHVVDFRQVKQG